MNVIYLWTNGNHVTYLAETLELEGYGCGVIDVHGKLENGNGHSYYLCCDMTEDVFVNNIKLPVLRQIRTNSKDFISSQINHVIWLKITRSTISKIRLYICNEKGDVQSFKGRGLFCTLLLIPNKKR